MATSPQPLSPQAAKSLTSDGFVVLPGPFAASEIAALQSSYDVACAAAAPDDVRVGSTSTRVNDFVNRDPIFDRVYTWPTALDAAQRVVGARHRLSAFHARTVHPGAAAQALHVDVPPTSDAWPMLGLILMVDDFRTDNGATRFIPNSPRRIDPLSTLAALVDGEHSDEVLACGPAGSVILFHASTWHGHAANASPRPRRSLQATFIPYTGTPATDFGARMRPDVYARLSPSARELLGVRVDTPHSNHSVRARRVAST